MTLVRQAGTARDEPKPVPQQDVLPKKVAGLFNFSRRPDFWCVTLLLAITMPMFLVGIGWGLPNHYSYAPDAISPIESLDALNSYVIRESGWCKKYPLGHYLLTGIMYQPYLAYLDLVGRGKPFRDAIERILATDQANAENHFQFLQQFVAFRPRMTQPAAHEGGAVGVDGEWQRCCSST
ncbi:MAG: hypothetical protein U1E76_25045 [Planctomycetota bacterium]